jgi:hypothetical protein
LIDTEAGVFYTKLRGAAQAPAALVSEIIVGALADALGLSVPARALIDIPPGLATDDRNDELAQLLRASGGRSLGFQHLGDARDFRAEDTERVDPELASTIFWLDALVMNPDRTSKNPNMLWSHGQLWLIDHGACLGFQHDWSAVTEQSPRAAGPALADHALASRLGQLPAVDERLTAILDRPRLEAAVDEVPGEYFLPVAGADAVGRRRASFVAFLWKRLRPPRPFLPAAEISCRKPAS